MIDTRESRSASSQLVCRRRYACRPSSGRFDLGLSDDRPLFLRQWYHGCEDSRRRGLYALEFALQLGMGVEIRRVGVHVMIRDSKRRAKAR